MYNPYLLFYLILISGFVKGQVLIEKAPTKSNWEHDGFSYADFGTGEEHSYFSMVYKMNPKLHGELQGFYDTYRMYDVFDLSFRMKWYPTEKVYFFSGSGMELIRDKLKGGPPNISLRILNGVGYDINREISLEAVHDLYFDKNNAGLNATPRLLTLKGKYRF